MRCKLLAAVLLAAPALALAAEEHGDPVAPILVALALILVAAKLGADVATRLEQPAVLGELVAGVIVGNLDLVGFEALRWIRTDPGVDVISRVGVVVLLFQVGLESTVGQMARVGISALLVAAIGVVTPFALGWGVATWLLPEHSAYVHAFIAATLTATSVGITARVMRDLGHSATPEARIVLGAAVIDDAMGLVILAIVGGVISAAATGGSLSVAETTLVVAKALGFLLGAIVLGTLVSRRLYRLVSRLRARGLLLPFGLSFCFLVSWLASVVGLAPIVGAFAAGLVFEETHGSLLVGRGEDPLDKQIEPVAAFLVPVFFVVMGMRTDLRAFLDPTIVGFAGALTAVALIGKIAAGLGALGGADRLSVGIGMIPRGEVGLIFANVGLSLSFRGEPIVSLPTYSAVVVMVIATTLVTPPALKWSLSRAARASGRTPAGKGG